MDPVYRPTMLTGLLHTPELPESGRAGFAVVPTC